MPNILLRFINSCTHILVTFKDKIDMPPFLDLNFLQATILLHLLPKGFTLWCIEYSEPWTGFELTTHKLLKVKKQYEIDEIIKIWWRSLHGKPEEMRLVVDNLYVLSQKTQVFYIYLCTSFPSNYTVMVLINTKSD